MVSVLGAYAQVQTSDQQKCLNAVNKDGAAVAKTQGKEHLGCVKGAGKGAVPSRPGVPHSRRQEQRRQEAKSKTTTDATKSCGAPPSFGFTSAVTMNASGKQADAGSRRRRLRRRTSIRGDHHLRDRASPAVRCQQKVSKEHRGDRRGEARDLRRVQESGAQGRRQLAAAALEACVRQRRDARLDRRRLEGQDRARSVTGLQYARSSKSCDTPNVIGWRVPAGHVLRAPGAALGACLDTRVECRVCHGDQRDGQPLRQLRPLRQRRRRRAAAPPVRVRRRHRRPTQTTPRRPRRSRRRCRRRRSHASRARHSVGKLANSSGRFNYNLTLGLPGSDAACAAAFGCTHTCSSAELQAGDAANELLAEPNNDVLGDRLGAAAESPVRPHDSVGLSDGGSYLRSETRFR